MEAPNRMELFLHPEKYGYKECSHCRGYGTSLKETAPKCTKCGGMGLVKKPDPVTQTHGIWKDLPEKEFKKLVEED